MTTKLLTHILQVAVSVLNGPQWPWTVPKPWNERIMSELAKRLTRTGNECKMCCLFPQRSLKATFVPSVLSRPLYHRLFLPHWCHLALWRVGADMNQDGGAAENCVLLPHFELCMKIERLTHKHYLAFSSLHQDPLKPYLFWSKSVRSHSYLRVTGFEICLRRCTQRHHKHTMSGYCQDQTCNHSLIWKPLQPLDPALTPNTIWTRCDIFFHASAGMRKRVIWGLKWDFLYCINPLLLSKTNPKAILL